MQSIGISGDIEKILSINHNFIEKEKTNLYIEKVLFQAKEEL